MDNRVIDWKLTSQFPSDYPITQSLNYPIRARVTALFALFIVAWLWLDARAQTNAPIVSGAHRFEKVAEGIYYATAKFTEPGDYVLHLTGNDYSGDGGGGFGCCWTTSLVKVAVKP